MPTDARVAAVPDLPEGVEATPLAVVAGMQQLDPADRLAPIDLDYERVGIDAPTTVYELTAPTGSPFEFDIVSQGNDLSGPVSVWVTHLGDGANKPDPDVASVLRAGVILSGPGQSFDGTWFRMEGDGFARATFHGRIQTDQIYAVRVESNQGVTEALVCVRPGAASAIALPESTGSDYPDLLEVRTLYSSPSPAFGLPVAAVSGDRTSVIAYEGDRGSGAGGRFELRLQLDHATGAVTGGAQQETSADSGNWRDHDVAALFNVLAVVQAGSDDVELRISFDRGATFTQTESFPTASLRGSARLASIAMAADYSLAVSYWRPTFDGGSELVVVRGVPSETAPDGSPTRFEFSAPESIHLQDSRVIPLITGLAWSDGGDLVVGYGYTRFVVTIINPQISVRPIESQSIFRCAVLPWNSGTWDDTLVDWETQIISRDPSVSAVGSYPDLRILYAYESRDGVMLSASRNGGQTFSEPTRHGPSNAYMPTVIARGSRVDLFYLATGSNGTELMLEQWRDFENGSAQTYRLTTAVRKDIREYKTKLSPGGATSISNGNFLILEADTTQIGNFGYDVARAGDELHVIVDEHRDLRVLSLGIVDVPAGQNPVFIGARGDAPFEPATPPTLHEGLTGPLPQPVAAHAHQLRLLRLR